MKRKRKRMSKEIKIPLSLLGALIANRSIVLVPLLVAQVLELVRSAKQKGKKILIV
jgi:hypothetical protein